MDFLSLITNPNDRIQTQTTNIPLRTIGGRTDTIANVLSNVGDQNITSPPVISFVPPEHHQDQISEPQQTPDQRPSSNRRRGTRPREDEEEGGSYGGAQKKYGIEFINPQNLERHSPIEDERSKTLGRTTECKGTHQNECPICSYDITAITNNSQQLGSGSSQRRPPKHMLYTPVDHETWKYMYSFVLSGLMIRQPVTACKNFATTWNNVILPNLKEEYPEYKQLSQVTAALIYDHYRYFPPTDEIRELFMKLDAEENVRILQDECGIVKRERNGPNGVYYVDKIVSGELKDWINIGRLISKKK